jgi:Nucleotidyl transferase
VVRAVVLVGGGSKGTRFRPLSLDAPKPLCPLGGRPLLSAHVAACARLQDAHAAEGGDRRPIRLLDVLLLGFYSPADQPKFAAFAAQAQVCTSPSRFFCELLISLASPRSWPSSLCLRTLEPHLRFYHPHKPRALTLTLITRTCTCTHAHSHFALSPSLSPSHTCSLTLTLTPSPSHTYPPVHRKSSG